MHRDDCRRGQPIAEALEIIGRDDVGADHGAPGRAVLNAGEAQPGRGVDDDKAEAELVEPIARLREAGAVEPILWYHCRREGPRVPAQPVERKLAAIFAADIVGYSRLMAPMRKERTPR